MSEPKPAPSPATDATGGSSAVGGAVKQGAQTLAESGVRKATGSDIAVDALRGAQKAKSGDYIGGAQDVAASAAGAGVTAAVAGTGAGAPVATFAGSTASKIVKSRLGRWAILGVILTVVAGIIAQMLLFFTVTSAIAGAMASLSGSAEQANSQVCEPGQYGGGMMVGSDIQEQTWNYLTTSGFSPEQAAGIMGNIQRESGFNPFIAEGATGTPRIGYGWGLVQWTAGRHAAIRDAVLNEPGLGSRFYIAAPNIQTMPPSMTPEDIKTMTQFQLEYIVTELNGPEKRAGDNLRKATTVEEATMIFERDYERAGVVALKERTDAALAIYDRYKGTTPSSPAPSPETTMPPEATDANAAIQETARPVINNGCGGYAGPIGEAGQIAPCPSGEAGCVNLAYLTQPSAGMACAPGTTDRGTEIAYFEGKGIQVRLCSLDRTRDLSGRPVIVNAIVSANFVAFDSELAAMGQPLAYTSSYRSMAEQTAIYNRGTGNAAKPGKSNHQFGMAFDINGLGSGYRRHNCGGKSPDGACITPTASQRARWDTIHSVGMKHGMYIHDQEFWHIEFTPSGLWRGRPIPHFRG